MSGLLRPGALSLKITLMPNGQLFMEGEAADQIRILGMLSLARAVVEKGLLAPPENGGPIGLH